MGKPLAGIFGLTGCAGDQLVILNCEDELLNILQALDVCDFRMASSRNDTDCELDIALVDGAVLSKRDEKALKRIRGRSKLLVAIGTCAVWGGVAAMDRNRDRDKLLRDVYGDMARQYDTTPARALHEVVSVDLNVSGCPIEKHQVLAGISALLNGDLPVLPEYPVCVDCKIREYNCLLLEKDQVCCGPLTVAGCNARCPAAGIPCVGCRGPVNEANTGSALAMFEEKGIPLKAVARKLATFAPVKAALQAQSGDRA